VGPAEALYFRTSFGPTSRCGRELLEGVDCSGLASVSSQQLSRKRIISDSATMVRFPTFVLRIRRWCSQARTVQGDIPPSRLAVSGIDRKMSSTIYPPSITNELRNVCMLRHTCGNIYPQIMPHTYNLPAQFSFVPSVGRWRLEEGIRPSDKLLVLEFPDELKLMTSQKRGEASPPHRPALNPWKLRDRFLRLQHCEADLIHFLNDVGRWDGSLGPFLVRNIWGWKDAINDLLLNPSHDWQEVISQHLNPYAGFAGLGAYLDFAFASPDKGTLLELNPRGCVGALLGTVLIDRAEGARFKVCRRPDCHQTYRLESRHERKYCSYYCAHLQSVRDSRRRSRRGARNSRI
jgi:hypothetical protein